MENFARCYVDPFIEFVTFHLVFSAVVPSRVTFRTLYNLRSSIESFYSTLV
jgi:hypothetical protein